ncbi:MAG: box helicase domain protein [Herbinix sp.]|jgi:ATP-dependent RNA helicase RhlE|nr:box helicase domain protein [Herbinix sp.]
MQFKDLNVIPAIQKALEKENYIEPTPIQEEAIPVILSGRDMLGCAQTGTGKTAAFAIPTLQLLSEETIPQAVNKNIRALIITPTRELALQIYESFNTYGKYTKLKSCVIFGGVSQKPQEEKLQHGVDILIATPGRLNDMINQKLINLQHIKIFILDEADRMLDMGFINDVNKIIDKTPPKKQTLLFSATMPPAIEQMSNTILNHPVKIQVTPVSSTVDTIKQYLYYVDKANKIDLLVHVLKDKSYESILVFTRTKHGADKVVRKLAKANITAEAIHGDKSQGARQKALNNFKSKSLRVLIATDIAARGIDIDELSLVINYELPNVPETYVHRIGRTGRAGLGGVAISFCDYDEKVLLADIEQLIEKKLIVVEDHPYPLQNNYPAEKNTQPRPNSHHRETIQREKEVIKTLNKHEEYELEIKRIRKPSENKFAKTGVKTFNKAEDKHKINSNIKNDAKTEAFSESKPEIKNSSQKRSRNTSFHGISTKSTSKKDYFKEAKGTTNYKVKESSKVSPDYASKEIATSNDSNRGRTKATSNYSTRDNKSGYSTRDRSKPESKYSSRDTSSHTSKYSTKDTTNRPSKFSDQTKSSKTPDSTTRSSSKPEVRTNSNKPSSSNSSNQKKKFRMGMDGTMKEIKNRNTFHKGRKY